MAPPFFRFLCRNCAILAHSEAAHLVDYQPNQKRLEAFADTPLLQLATVIQDCGGLAFQA